MQDAYRYFRVPGDFDYPPGLFKLRDTFVIKHRSDDA
jgi:hypothetical protein